MNLLLDAELPVFLPGSPVPFSQIIEVLCSLGIEDLLSRVHLLIVEVKLSVPTHLIHRHVHARDLLVTETLVGYMGPSSLLIACQGSTSGLYKMG